MRRSVVAALVAVIGVSVFLTLVPVVSITEYVPCPPTVPSCPPRTTYAESVFFHSFRVGAIYGFCTGSDYRIADAIGGYGCADGQFFTR